MGVHFNFEVDPKTTKVLTIALLLFLESFLGSGIIILQNNRVPTTSEFVLILFVAALLVVTYLLSWMRTGSTDVPVFPKMKEAT